MEKPAEAVAPQPTQNPKDAAYWQGYNDCKKAYDKKASGITHSNYAPVPGYETEYKAGWDKAQSEADKKIIRGGGVTYLIAGSVLIIAGGGWLYFMISSKVRANQLMVMAGLLALSGLGLFIRGLLTTLSGRDFSGD